MSDSRFQLKTLLARGGCAVILLLTAILSMVIGQMVNERITRNIGQSFSTLAFQLADKLDRGMFERYRDIQIAAKLGFMVDEATTPTTRRLWVETLQTTYPDYAWIGFTEKRAASRFLKSFINSIIRNEIDNVA